MWRFCKAGGFSYGESQRTPPLEGTSLHRRSNSVERPWGILSLFTTCLLITSEFAMPEADTDMWRLCKAGGFSYGESPRTPPLEGTSLHRRSYSVERPWGILSLFTTCLLITTLTQMCGVFVKQVVFLTVNHRGPLPLRELHSTDEAIVWRDPRGSWAFLPPVY